MNSPFAHLSNQWRWCIQSFLRQVSPSGSANTPKNYTSILAAFLRDIDNPGRVTRSQVESFLWEPVSTHKARAGMPPKAGTRNIRKAVLSSFFAYASEYIPAGASMPIYTGKSPVKGIQTSKPDINYRGMSVEEVQHFFSVIDRSTLIGKRDFAVFAALYFTSRRLREIADLKMSDIRREIITDGKERREAFTYRFRNKGAKGQEDVAELSPLVKDAIDCYLEASGRLPLTPNEPIFTMSVQRVDHWPPLPIVSTTVRSRMKHYLQLAGLDSRLSPHSFRHASAAARLSNGASIPELQRLLRHRQADTTMRYAAGLVSTGDPGLAALEKQLTTTESQPHLNHAVTMP